MTDKSALRACILSGQASASQVSAHHAAGEYDANIGYEAGRVQDAIYLHIRDPLPIMYAEPEPREEDPAPPFGPAWAVYGAVILAFALLAWAMV